LCTGAAASGRKKILQDRVFWHPKITVVWNGVVDEIIGESLDGKPKAVTGLRIRNTIARDTGLLAAQGVFVAIGHDPATSLFGEYSTWTSAATSS
jgi:thioredoxin reductase (NADPH)